MGSIAWRSVLVATGVSILGDQLARVAVALLVFQRSGSAAWTAVAYGLTLVPELVGGLVLGGMADRYPRRTVMVACAGMQAGLVALMAVPGMPLVGVAIAIAGVSALAAPARGAQSASVYDLLGPQHSGAGQARLMMLTEAGQLVGLAAGAGVVAVVGITGALVADAISFAAASAVLWTGLAHTAASAKVVSSQQHQQKLTTAGSSSQRGTSAAWRIVSKDPVLRIMSILVVMVAWGAVPAAIMAPLVQQMHSPSWWVGIALAADCAGVVIGAAVVARISAQHQPRLIGPLAVATYLPLAVFLIPPTISVAITLFVLSGIAQSYLPLTKSVFGIRLDGLAPQVATSAYSLVGVGMRAAQGVTALLGGALAVVLNSAVLTVGVVGAVGTALATVGAWRWRVIRTGHSVLQGTA